MTARVWWLIVGGAVAAALSAGAYFVFLKRAPSSRSIDVAGLQRLADAACACRQGKEEGSWTPGKPSSCWKAFDDAVVPLGYANGLVAADGPLTSEYIYIGPRAAKFDFAEPKNEVEPPSVTLSYPYGECSLAASQRHSRDDTGANRGKREVQR